MPLELEVKIFYATALCEMPCGKSSRANFEKIKTVDSSLGELVATHMTDLFKKSRFLSFGEKRFSVRKKPSE